MEVDPATGQEQTQDLPTSAVEDEEKRRWADMEETDQGRPQSDAPFQIPGHLRKKDLTIFRSKPSGSKDPALDPIQELLRVVQIQAENQASQAAHLDSIQQTMKDMLANVGHEFQAMRDQTPQAVDLTGDQEMPLASSGPIQASPQTRHMPRSQPPGPPPGLPSDHPQRQPVGGPPGIVPDPGMPPPQTRPPHGPPPQGPPPFGLPHGPPPSGPPYGPPATGPPTQSPYDSRPAASTAQVGQPSHPSLYEQALQTPAPASLLVDPREYHDSSQAVVESFPDQSARRVAYQYFHPQAAEQALTDIQQGRP